MTNLRGHDSDRPDNVAKEFLIMQAIQGRQGQTLQTIYPIIIGRPHQKGDPGYPKTGNFFTQSGHLIEKLIDASSPATSNAVSNFLKQRVKIESPDELSKLTVRNCICGMLAKQGAQLWNHSDGLPEEEIQGDAELYRKMKADPPVPPLDLEQLKALKAQLRALVPGVHEVIDRAYQEAARCRASS